MNRRMLVLILGAAILVGIVAVIVTVLRKPSSTANGNANLPIVISNTNAAADPSDVERAAEAAKIRSVAVVVSEAWGSGPVSKSNQRLVAASSYLTDNLRAYAEAQAAKPQDAVATDTLQAAKSLTQVISGQTADRATVSVTLQVSSTVVPVPPNAGSPEVTYRKLELGMQKVGDAWKVSEILDKGSVEL